MVHVFCNPELIQNIHHVPKAMKICCNGRICTTNLIADLPGYGAVWFDPEAIVNIFSLKLVQEKFYIAYDSK